MRPPIPFPQLTLANPGSRQAYCAGMTVDLDQPTSSAVQFAASQEIVDNAASEADVGS
jgi:hypothetical protein